jgi:flavin reductase (DIM6/NTAB) family NADH-FMN oxidoreductase RutF
MQIEKIQSDRHHKVSSDAFREFAAHWPSGVAVITTVDNDGMPKGLTMTAVTSLSMEPRQFLICVDNRSATLQPILDSVRFCINFLGSSQQDVAALFASKREDKFTAVKWAKDALGMPAIEGAVANASCEVVAVHNGGDHRIIVGELRGVSINGGAPLIYQLGRFLSTH